MAGTRRSPTAISFEYLGTGTLSIHTMYVPVNYTRCLLLRNRVGCAGGNGVGADEGGRALLTDCQFVGNKQCGAMASGLHAEMHFTNCVASKNGTHGIAAAGRACITAVGTGIKNSKQLGFLIQSGATADIKDSIVTKNGAHGICLQLGGIATLTNCQSLKNKQTGVAVMGAASKATAHELTSSDNGIDGCHVGQGAELDACDCVMEGNERMGLSALGFDTKAVVQGCVITGNTEHGIAQGQGAQVRVANNTVKDNKKKDVFGNVHDFGIDAYKPSSSPKGKDSRVPKHEDTPLMGGGAGGASIGTRKRIKNTIIVLVAGAILLGAVYTFVSYEHLNASSSTPQHAGTVPRGARRTK